MSSQPMRFLLSFFFILSLSFSPALPGVQYVYAANTKIRQEINIIDGYVGSASGSYATSSAIINIDTSLYNGATYYFEVVASTSAATNSTFYLKNASTYAIVATISNVNGTTYARYRSSSFSPTSGSNDYVLVAGNESVQKGAIAARVIILQDAASITNTVTQIEIGNKESYTTTSTSTFSSPKYWYYDSTKWDGNPTFYAEVTYARTSDITSNTSSSTNYLTPGTYTYQVTSGATQVVVEAWGGGGAGGGGVTNQNNTSGGGGAGGQYAKKTISSPTGSHTLVVAATRTGSAGATGPNGNDSTYDSTTVVAKGGQGGSDWGPCQGGFGSTTGGVGDVVYRGGHGQQCQTGASGAGGGGAGSGGDGGDATQGGSGVGPGTATGGGNGGALVSASGNQAGNAGTQAGGGGSGSTRGGVPGTGAAGRITLTETIAVGANATTTISLQEDDGNFGSWTDKKVIVSNGTASSATRVRSSSFTPTSGRHYRIVFKSGYNEAAFAIYNAKIIVDQTSPTLLEPQYLVVNTLAAAGTSLQKFLTYWDPSEWTTGNAYTFIHEANSVSGGTSDGNLTDNSGSPDVTGSTLTNITERKRSTMTMPAAAAALDFIATTNNNDIYSSRILVQVDPTGIAQATTVSKLRKYGGSLFKVIKGSVRVR